MDVLISAWNFRRKRAKGKAWENRNKNIYAVLSGGVIFCQIQRAGFDMEVLYGNDK